MRATTRNSFAWIAPLALLVLLAVATPGAAQSAGPLPTAPGAERAASGGLTQAHASLPGGPGLSPLEPWLILWLLPLSGIATAAAGLFVDRRMRERPAAGRRATR